MIKKLIQRLQNLSISKRLLVLTLSSTALTLAIAGLSYWSIQSILNRTSGMIHSGIGQMGAAFRLNADLITSQTTVQTMIRLKDIDAIEKAYNAVKEADHQARTEIAQAGESAAPINSAYNKLAATNKKILNAFLRGHNGTAFELSMTVAAQQFADVMAAIHQYERRVRNETYSQASAFQHTTVSEVVSGAITVAIILLVMAVFIWRMKASISRALLGISEQINSSVTRLSRTSQQFSAASQSLADGSGEQAASLQETSASLEEMSSMVIRNADHAEKAWKLADQTKSAADDGSARMDQMRRAVDDIKASSDNIAKIIKTIDEIAFQTNILALNAAVEAARAGEAGMGFAVVAEEVRSLAQRSATAARETAEKIEDSIRKSEAGVSICAEVGSSLDQIVGRTGEVYQLISEISTASTEQSKGIEQISASVHEMDKVTQTNAANAEEGAAASVELHTQSKNLGAAVQELYVLIHGHELNTMEMSNALLSAEHPHKSGKAAEIAEADFLASTAKERPPRKKAAKAKQEAESEFALPDAFKDF